MAYHISNSFKQHPIFKEYWIIIVILLPKKLSRIVKFDVNAESQIKKILRIAWEILIKRISLLSKWIYAKIKVCEWDWKVSDVLGFIFDRFKSLLFPVVDSFTNFTYLAAVFSFEIFARVAELGDALDLGSSPARGGGSTPPFRMNTKARRTRKARKKKNEGHGEKKKNDKYNFV